MPEKPIHINLHDIAFEGRNKEYGAYELRNTAGRRVRISLYIAVIIFLSLTALLYYGMEWIRASQPIYYVMPSVTVGLDNSISSAFPKGKSEVAGAKNRNETSAVQTPEDTQQFNPEVISDDNVTDNQASDNSSDANATKGNNNGISSGIPWGDGEVFLTADVIPQFIGGREALSKYLSKNVRYPEEAIDRRLQGTVMICFVVTDQGLVKDAKVVKGIDPVLDNEALRVVSSMPAWKPGLRAGRPVNIVLTLPIRFDLHLHFSG